MIMVCASISFYHVGGTQTRGKNEYGALFYRRWLQLGAYKTGEQGSGTGSREQNLSMDAEL
jgi:hypothetical protein